MARAKQSGDLEAACGCKKSCLTKREKTLACMLAWVTLIWSVFWVSETFKDYNRYELVQFHGMEGTAAYKIDKKTGTVTGIFNLYEFDLQKFRDTDAETKHWQWGNRSEASIPLLYHKEYLQ